MKCEPLYRRLSRLNAAKVQYKVFPVRRFKACKLLENKSGAEKQELLFQEKGINWNEYLPKYKRGVVIKKHSIFIDGENGEPVQRSKWIPDYNTPIFTQDKDYLYNLIPKV